MDEQLLLSFRKVEDVHWWFVARRRIVLSWLGRWAPDARTFLEVGSGTGGFIAALREQRPDVTARGVEPSAGAAELARARGVDVGPGTFEDLPADDASADVLLALDVLEHCADDAVALAEAARVVRPGGVLLLTVPALAGLWSPHDELNHHYRRYSPESLTTVVEGAGFEPLEWSFFGSLLLPIAAPVRIASRVLRIRRPLGLPVPPKPVNAVLEGIFGMEEPILREHRLPIGMSLILVARRTTPTAACA